MKVEWDDILPEEICENWIKWLSEFQTITDVTIDRKIINFSEEEIFDIQLQIFGDSSEKAYGTVAYLRIITDETISVSFVMAKTRVAPIKKKSIPKLELLAALMCVRMSRFILKTLSKFRKEVKIVLE